MMEKRFRWSKKAGNAALAAGILASVLLFAGCGKNAEQTAESIAQTETSGREDSQVQQESNEAENSQEESSTQESVPYDMEAEEIEMAPTGTYDGIIVDAAMNSMVIDTAEGKMYAVSFPETEDVVDTADGLLLGQAVTVSCKDGMASSVTDSSRKPAADREALSFAADVLFACKYRDINALSELAGYPVYINLGEKDQVVESGGDFLKIPASDILTEERVKAVLGTNLFDLKELDGGKYVLGAEEGKPNIIFQKDDGRDSGFAITGIN